MKIKIGFGMILFLIYSIISKRAFDYLFLLSVLLHELGHLIAAAILKRRISCIKIEPLGARISFCGILSYKDEIIIALMGPLVNLFTAALFWQYEISKHSLILGIFNLLPGSSLDGGRILTSLLSIYRSPEVAEYASKTISTVIITIIWIVSVYGLLCLNMGASLFVISCILFINTFDLGQK